MYRVYIIAAGRQANPARFGIECVWPGFKLDTQLTGGWPPVTGRGAGTRKKTAPSKTVNQPLPAETTGQSTLRPPPLHRPAGPFREMFLAARYTHTAV